MKEDDNPPKYKEAATPKRRLGFLKGQYTIPDDFEKIDREADREIERTFYADIMEPSESDEDAPPAEVPNSKAES